MSEPTPQLNYEPYPTQRRRVPAWVWSIVAVYLLLLFALLTLPIWVSVIWDEHEWQFFVFAGGAIAVMVVCGLILLITPVRLVKGIRHSQRSYLGPLIVAGFLFGLLVLGGAIAVVELCLGASPGDAALWAVLAGALLTWAGWTFWFFYAPAGDPTSLAARFHRWLIVGSVAELLVAVPCHVVVRRREECCAGIFTGTAIFVGAGVMFVAFGPSVLLLYYRRARQIKPISLSPAGRGQAEAKPPLG